MACRPQQILGRRGAFFVPDLIRLEVGRGDRVVVVSDLHLRPAATDVSARAADELAELLDGFREPGMLVLAGDAFELLAAAPDVAAIMDAHPQFTAAVKRFAADPGHRVVLTPGNHDGQLAWDEESVTLLRDRLGVTDVGLACDLAVSTGDGSQLVRVMHGHQFDPVQRVRRPPVPGRHPPRAPRRPAGPAEAGVPRPARLAARRRPVVQRGSWRFPGIAPALPHGGGLAVVAGGAVRGGAGAALPDLRAGGQAAAEPSR